MRRSAPSLGAWASRPFENPWAGGHLEGRTPAAPKTDEPPDKPSHVDMYADGHKVRARRLPLYLLDAIRAFDKDRALKAALGNSFSASYVKLKMQEWDEYSKHLTEWERTTTLDC
ncbi:MAG: hypothetical protein OXC08_07520 [Thiotrichales bacterium]|nr:hypothetical protein [Thiotrichales bacterium]